MSYVHGMVVIIFFYCKWHKNPKTMYVIYSTHFFIKIMKLVLNRKLPESSIVSQEYK